MSMTKRRESTFDLCDERGVHPSPKRVVSSKGEVMSSWQVKIDELRALEDDWDSDGAPKPTEAVLTHVERIAHDSPRYITDIFAASDGGVVICFDYMERSVQFNFENDGSIKLICINMSSESYTTLDVAVEAVDSMVNRINDFLAMHNDIL